MPITMPGTYIKHSVTFYYDVLIIISVNLSFYTQILLRLP